jgi:hypothetical protein
VGGASFHGTGLNSGVYRDLRPLTLSALSRHIERFHVIETTNFSFYPSQQMIFEMMGMGNNSRSMNNNVDLEQLPHKPTTLRNPNRHASEEDKK